MNIDWTVISDWLVKAATVATPFVLALMTYMQRRVSAKVDTLEHHTNSIMDRLLILTGEQAHAEGLAEGRAERPTGALGARGT
jgi:hypothetical protein